MVEIKNNAEYKLLIAECTAYDFKVMLEESRPKSWLKSVSAFANTTGGSLFFGIDNDGAVKGLEDIQHVTEVLDGYRDELRPAFKSSASQFMTIIYSTQYGENGQVETKSGLSRE